MVEAAMVMVDSAEEGNQKPPSKDNNLLKAFH